MLEEPSCLQIMVYGTPVLHQKAEEIKDINADILSLARAMVATMHSAPGIGLAAPQVNRGIRLITVDLSVGEKENELIVLLNPEILHRDGSAVMEEGCLSVPDINDKVIRPQHVVIKGLDLNGNERTIEAEGLQARVFCHEIDHLNGKLFIDHLSPLKRNLAKKKLRKQLEKAGEE